MASGASLTRDSHLSISSTPSKAPVAVTILAKDSLISELDEDNCKEYKIMVVKSLKRYIKILYPADNSAVLFIANLPPYHNTIKEPNYVNKAVDA